MYKFIPESEETNMATKKISVGVIGLRMGKLHAEAGKTFGAKLGGLCDPDPEKLDTARTELKVPKKNCFSDYRDMLANTELDAVIIASPDMFHREQVHACLEKGLHVMCEKPLALTHEDMVAIIEDVKAHPECKFMVGQICRHTPGFLAAKNLIDEGKIGELVFVESEYAHNYNHARGYNDWRVVPERHGFIGGGCHAVDLLRWIAGDPTEVYAHANHKIMLDWPTDDTVISIYKFPNGVSGKVFVSIGSKRNYTMRSVFYGTKGTIITDNTSPEITLFTELSEDGDFTKEIKVPVDINNHNATAEIEAFVDALVNNKPMPVSSKEGAYTVAVCCAAVESSKTGKPVDIVYPKADR